MVKVSELSSDINVIKEFEELKLKQKLLIESLKNNTDSNQNKLFLEINSKLDFLVKIFTEANQADDEGEEKVDFNSKFNEILESISSFSQETKESFSKLDERITKLEKDEVQIPEIKVPEVKVDEPKIEDIKIDKPKVVDEVKAPNVSSSDKKVVSEQKKSIDSTNVELPPIPKPDFEIKIDELAKDEKKKKWF